jgi:hypothetical protein
MGAHLAVHGEGQLGSVAVANAGGEAAGLEPCKPGKNMKLPIFLWRIDHGKIQLDIDIGISGPVGT